MKHAAFVLAFLLLTAMTGWGQTVTSKHVAGQPIFTAVIVTDLNTAGCQALKEALPPNFPGTCVPSIIVEATLPAGSAVRFVIVYLDENGNQQTVSQTVDAGSAAQTIISSGSSATCTSALYANAGKPDRASFGLLPGGDFTLQTASASLLLPERTVTLP